MLLFQIGNLYSKTLTHNSSRPKAFVSLTWLLVIKPMDLLSDLENLSRGDSSFYVTNLVYSLLNIFICSMNKWGNTPLLMSGVDEVIPTWMVCKAI